ncbi:MAG: hypothetical protein FJ308_05460 [Planctomycetes bacterium]|nr:hypothetical protein [Planctomycetota bacterium]
MVVVPNSTPQPMFATQQMIHCGNPQGNADSHSPLALLMDADPCHPSLWASYPAERAARLNHLYHHLNGCDCLDLERGLHSQPSMICGDTNGGHGTACSGSECDSASTRINRYRTQHGSAQKATFSSLYSEPTAACSSGCKPLGVHKLFKPTSSCDTVAPSAVPAPTPAFNATQAPNPSNRLAVPSQLYAAPSVLPIAANPVMGISR